MATSSNENSWINNSFIDEESCASLMSVQIIIWLVQPILVKDGSVSLINTSMPNGTEMIASGELSSWYLDVRVTDLDNQWTPNATVTVTENSFLVS